MGLSKSIYMVRYPEKMWLGIEPGPQSSQILLQGHCPALPSQDEIINMIIHLKYMLQCLDVRKVKRKYCVKRSNFDKCGMAEARRCKEKPTENNRTELNRIKHLKHAEARLVDAKARKHKSYQDRGVKDF